MTKQKTKRLPDVDTRGRVRRIPTIKQVEPIEFIKIRLWGGPMHDTQVEVMRGTKKYPMPQFRVSMWVYEDTGQKDPQGLPLFALRPNSRAQRLFIALALAATKRDQRLYVPQTPVKSTKVSTKGRGATKRRAKREAASVRAEG